MDRRSSCVKLARQIMELVMECYGQVWFDNVPSNEDDSPDTFLTDSYRTEIIRIFALDEYSCYNSLSQDLPRPLIPEVIFDLVLHIIMISRASSNSMNEFYLKAFCLCTFGFICLEEGRAEFPRIIVQALADEALYYFENNTEDFSDQEFYIED